ncbi:MAG TPA: D-serine ammonia-lyase [Lactobacillaceae bacterium]
MMPSLTQLHTTFPQIEDLANYNPLFWQNPHYGERADLPFSQADIFDAVARWQRFAPYLAQAFPETTATNGSIESPLLRVANMQKAFETLYQTTVPGKIFVKADSLLPISGSIKSRGGIYEVLKFAEQIAIEQGGLSYEDDYSVLLTPKFKQLFAQYGIAVGSTGNLGLSIGMAGASFGFQTTVHMSADARAWKKDLLRSKGVTVVEYDSDFTTAITAGRLQAENEPNTYFVDDEGSRDLFLGYASAAVHLQKQLHEAGVFPDADHPVFVYLPAGVGGSPAGVSFGMKSVLGEHIYPVFVEPTHVPSVTLGMMTGLNDEISVYDIGLDGKTHADGLAVGRPSRIAGHVMKTLLYGSQTFTDDVIYAYLTLLHETETLKVEPSSSAGFTGILPTIAHFDKPEILPNATHIVWATGGLLLPEDDYQTYVQHGQEVLDQMKSHG